MSNNAKNIVWLSSYPKSGNTWFRIFLNDLFNCSEYQLDINSLKLTPICSARNLFDDNLGITSSDLTNEEIDRLRPHLYSQISKQSEEVIFFKVHDSWQKVEGNTELFPSSHTKGVLYFIRNPLDIVVSLAYHNNCTLDRAIEILNDPTYCLSKSEQNLANQLQQRVSSWSNHVLSWCFESKLPVFTMKYEDMLENTFEVFFRAIEFLELNFTEREIRRSIVNTSFDKLKAHEIKYGFLEKPMNSKSFFREGKANLWTSSLNNKQIESISKSHGSIMEKYGYL